MSEITTTGKPIERQIPRAVWIALAAIVVVLYFLGLNITLLGPDEPRYAQVAREMFERSDWITPTLGGAHWFEKPALLYWLEIVSFKLLGVSEFSARLGSAVFGLATIAVLWILGRFAERHDDAAGTRTLANWLALIAASTLGIIVFSRGASFDIIVTFPLTASLVCFYLFDRSENGTFRQRYLPLIFFYVFIGVAMLAKGLIGIIFPFAIVGAYYLVSWRWPGKAFILSVIWGTLIAAAVAGIWYVPMYQENGWQFIDEFFIQHHFQRFTSNKYLHPQPFIFFFWVLPLMTLPWLPLFVAAVVSNAKRVYARLSTDRQEDDDGPHESPYAPLKRLAAVWLLIPLAFFSFSGSKLPGYILPSVPPAIILTSLYTYRLVTASRKWRIAVLATASGTLVISIVLVLFVLPHFADTDSVRSLIRSADDRGYANARVINLHMISHNSEFYAAKRLSRDDNGKLRRFNSNVEVREFITVNGGSPVLALIPLEHLKELTRDQTVRSEVLSENGEVAIAAVSLP